MKRTIPLLLLGIFCSSAWAQSLDEKKAFINSIKKDTLYLSADQVGESEEVAINLADGKLLAQINEWVAEQKKVFPSQMITSNSHEEMFQTVTMPRGNLFRAFRYVKKSELLAAVTKVDNAAPAAKEQPVVTDSVPAGEGALFSLDDTSLPPEATIETVEEPVAEVDLSSYPEAVVELSKLTAFSQLKDCILQLKKDGKISSYGKYEQLSPKEDYYLLIYNTSGELEGLLTPAKPERKNVKTGQPDSEKNYPGRGAFGIKI